MEFKKIYILKFISFARGTTKLEIIIVLYENTIYSRSEFIDLMNVYLSLFQSKTIT